MEAAAGVAARGVSLPLSSSSQPSRKEWRVVSEQSVRSSSNEDMGRSKAGLSDERLIYEVQQRREPADVDFCSITIDGSLENDILQQRLHTVVKQREELQQMELELRAQVIARSEIIEIQKTFDAQIKEHANANVKLQEQLHEKEQKIRELEEKLEEKERELHAIRLDNEAAWAKEDLLREQSKELQSYRRERDSSEAERAQHIKQIHDLQEHIQEKERQFMELQEQHRIAQETVLFKDDQLREAQAWITRAQEMDALQSSTNHTLQAELRERAEQYNQLWVGCQRQFGEIERLHLHIQQLQLELADMREKSGSHSDGSIATQASPKDAVSIGQSNGNQLETTGSSTQNGNSGSLQNGNSENVSSLVSAANTSSQADNVHGVTFVPSSLLGMPSYLPPGQVTALHPFVMHQQGVHHSVQSHVTQPHFPSVAAMPSLQHWQNPQAVSDGQEVPSQNQYQPLQAEPNLLRSDSDFDYGASVNGQVLHSKYLDGNISQAMDPDSTLAPSNGNESAVESTDKSYLAGDQSQQNMQNMSSQFHEALRLHPLEHKSDTKGLVVNHADDNVLENQNFMTEQPISTANTSSESPNHAVKYDEATVSTASGIVPDPFVSAGVKVTHAVGKPAEPALLDERSLLACIVRTIGSGGRIRISSTLPNRLGKMLAPLHWHDYKKKYGKLDDFVASHPKLFLIEGDYIQLREGAQEIIAATATAAKVAAAAAAPSSYSSLLPSVAVTPMAQSHHRLKKASIESVSALQKQHLNGVSFNAAGGISSIKILSKPTDHVELNGPEPRPGQSVNFSVGNGTNVDNHELGNSRSRRPAANFPSKQQGRVIGAASSPRR